MFPPQDMKPLVISYSINQPVKPQLWGSNFYPVSLFGTNEYLEEDSKNIVCFLLRIAVFIKQCKLERKLEKDIFQIAEFSFALQEFIFLIYKVGWNKLLANNDHKSFKQYVLIQFNNNKSFNSMKNQSQKIAPKGKQANISKVPPLISSHPSKKILEKSKFFMKNLTSSLTRNLLKKLSHAQASKGS